MQTKYVNWNCIQLCDTLICMFASSLMVIGCSMASHAVILLSLLLHLIAKIKMLSLLHRDKSHARHRYRFRCNKVVGIRIFCDDGFLLHNADTIVSSLNSIDICDFRIGCTF